MRVKINKDQEDLFCNSCKERIHEGDKYIESEEEYIDEVIIKPFHLECIEIDEDETDEVWISPTEE